MDNDYKNTVGQALIKFGYVKLRKTKGYPRIMGFLDNKIIQRKLFI